MGVERLQPLEDPFSSTRGVTRCYCYFVPRCPNSYPPHITVSPYHPAPTVKTTRHLVQEDHCLAQIGGRLDHIDHALGADPWQLRGLRLVEQVVQVTSAKRTHEFRRRNWGVG